MGEIHLDLRGATILGPEPTIKLWVLIGNLRVLVPRGIHVQVDTSSLLGGRSITAYGPPRSQLTPVVRIRMIDMLGAVKVTADPAAWSPRIVPAPPV
jgi:predicted membrane protein